MDTRGLDRQKAEAFAGRMIGTLNEGAIAVMTSIGHRTGLFDVMSGLPYSTSEEIAGAANLDEHYVREWLGAMTVGGIVEHDPQDATYYLPPEHAAFLTRAASPDNVAVAAQFIPVMGSIEDEIVEVFRRGGGVPYSAFPRFHEVMAEDSAQTVVVALVDHILPLVPGLTQRLEAGIEVLDIGCGSGKALNLMARSFSRSRFTGYDISEEGVLRAIIEAKRYGSTNVRFEVKDAVTLDETARYDLITTFDAVHDQASPATVLENIAVALKHDGVYLMQEIASASHVRNNIDHPLGPFLYAISTTRCTMVSLAQDGEGLKTMWGEERAREMLEKAGFRNVHTRRLDHDMASTYYVVRKY